ncbi:hypothetical protein EIP91_007606, partial [Steccherinum ochraceum]
MPALYCRAVIDFDQTRGVAVFGNAFGELAVCDLSSSDPESLEACFKPLAIPALNRPEENILSTTEPILYEGRLSFPSLDATSQFALAENGAGDEPDVIPDCVLRRMQGRFLDMAWVIARVYHYYGPITPLGRLWDRLGDVDYFLVGGLIIGFAAFSASSSDAIRRGLATEDILVRILCMLSSSDIVSMRKSCQEVNRISRTKQLWLVVFQRELLRDAITYPLAQYVRSLDDLSAHETECLVVQILRHRRNRKISAVPGSVVRFDQVKSVTWVKILQGSWLIVASSDRSASSISLWKVADVLSHAAQAKPVAEASLPAPVCGGTVDVQDDSITISISLSCDRAVFDMDQTRGIIVVGNAFGELGLCDLSGSSPESLEGCFRALSLPQVAQEDILRGPSEPISYHGEYSFPLVDAAAGSTRETLTPVPDMADDWVIHRPVSPFKTSQMQGTFIDLAWILAHVYHYYGSVQPLGELEASGECREYFLIGGILVELDFEFLDNIRIWRVSWEDRLAENYDLETCYTLTW